MAFIAEQRKDNIFQTLFDEEQKWKSLSADELKLARRRYQDIQENKIKLLKYQLIGKRRMEKNVFKALLQTNYFYTLKHRQPLRAIMYNKRLYMHRQLGNLLSTNLKNKFSVVCGEEEGKIKNLLGNTDLALRINDTVVSWLSYDNILAQLKLLNRHAGAAQDGLAVTFYLKFAYIFIPIFQQLFGKWCQVDSFRKINILSYFSCFLKDTNTKVIHQQYNVGYSTLDNLRPVNNEEADAKLFARLLNEELFKIVANSIHKNQFALRGRSIHNALFLLKEAHITAKLKKDRSAVILFVDMRQAYDSVKHSYLLNILYQHLGATPLYYGLVNYITGKFGALKFNYEFYKPFGISVGITQGSPCSGILYALYMNECLNQIQQNLPGLFIPSIGENLKLISYADDLAVVCNDQVEIELALEIIESFENISGLTINRDKTTACYLRDFRNFDCGLGNKIAGYLGLPHPFFGMEARLKVQRKILQTTTDLLKSLEKVYMSIKSRIVVVNTLCIPKLNYVAPVYDFPKSFLQHMNVMFNKFIWKGKLALVSRRLLYLSPKAGGLGLINLGIFMQMLRVNALGRWIVFLASLDIVIPVKPTDTPPPWFLQSVFGRLDIVRKNFVDDIPEQRLKQKFRYAEVRDEIYKDVVNPNFHIKGVLILRSIEASLLPPNMFDFTFKMLHQRLPTYHVLINGYRMNLDITCVLCGRCEETQDHLLCCCSSLVELRNWAQQLIQRDLEVFIRTHDALLWLMNWKLILRFVLIVWYGIWKLRCARIFKNIHLRPINFMKIHLQRFYNLDLKTLNPDVVDHLWPMVDLDDERWFFLKD